MKLLNTKAVLLYLALCCIIMACSKAMPKGSSPGYFNNHTELAIEELEVLPVIFLPQNEAVDIHSLSDAKHRLKTMLNIARQTYKELLNIDRSFLISDSGIEIYSAQQSYADYQQTNPDIAHRIVKELFEWQNDDRMLSNKLYLVIVVNQHDNNLAKVGGGRTFNGQPGSGGAIVLMEYSSLVNDQPYPFLSTLIHELGHGFGLSHVDCLGYDMSTNPSVMSYNLDHHSNGSELADVDLQFNPEELFILSQNVMAFPDFQFNPALHNPGGKNLNSIESCYLGRMTDFIGPISQEDGKGYELFFNGRKVNGVEAVFYTFSQAKKNCEWNVNNKPNTQVECRFNGVSIK